MSGPMEPTARTLTLDLLSTLRHGAMPVRALVEAGGWFGFAENNVRVSLSKLLGEGRVARDERGSYRLAPATEALSRQLRRWRKLEEEQRPWKGAWVAVQAGRLSRSPALRRRTRAVEAVGLRALEPGLLLRPDNLRGGVEAVRERLRALVAAGDAPVLVYRAEALDPETDLRARQLWDVDALVAGYEAGLDALARSHARLDDMRPEQVRVETFRVGGRVVRDLMSDPLLPPAILDPAPRRALVDAMRAYDDRARTAWAPFLAEHGVPSLGSAHGWRATHGVLPDAAVQ